MNEQISAYIDKRGIKPTVSVRVTLRLKEKQALERFADRCQVSIDVAAQTAILQYLQRIGYLTRDAA